MSRLAQQIVPATGALFTVFVTLVIPTALLAALAGVLYPAAAQEASAPLLVSPEWLAQHEGDPNLVLFHVGERAQYDREHIAGAQFVEISQLSTPHAEGELMLELPPADELRARLEAMGVSDDSRIVVYYGDDWVTPSTRVLFTLHYLGLGDHTSLLNGGMQAWKREGHPVTARATPAPRRGTLRAGPTRDDVVDAAYVRTIADRPRTRLVDARAGVFYDGVEAGSDRRGHIPGAVSLPYSDTAGDDLVFRPDELRERFRAAGIEPGDTVIAYCHIGQQATAVVFAARLIGIDARLYDGSMQDWSARGFPVEARAAAER